MTSRDETTKYGTALPEDDFLLEEILAEYGGGREQKLMRDVEHELDPLKKMRPQPPAPVPETPKPPKEKKPQKPVLPDPPKPLTLKDVVGDTVDAVMEENRENILPPKRSLFSRRKLEETEQLYDTAAAPEPEPEIVPEPIGPEKDLYEAAAENRLQMQSARSTLLPAFLTALVPVVLMLAEQVGGLVIPYWTGDIGVQSIVLLACLLITALLCRQVFGYAVRQVRKRRCTCELVICVSALVAAADCAACLAVTTRTATPPYGSAAVLALAFAQAGVFRRYRGMYDTYRAAAIDDAPPYLVTDTARGACKQRGSIAGFYTAAEKPDTSTMWQAALMPVVLVGSVVFAVLSSFGQGRGGDFLLNWSAILAAGATFSMPLSWPLPWSKLTAHLQKTGCAVAGWYGAEAISRRRSMIVTDADLVPPGTIQLNGVKVYSVEMRVAVSHAATVARAAGSGLERLFDGLLRSEMGHYETLEDFSFYAEGGWSGTIRGESILLGTASFMKKMDVRIPTDINLKTGIFLAVDRQLTAVFAVKYQPSEHVDFALRMTQRSHITPILAVRDPNITPQLLQRKFHKGVRVQYPDITTRVALSEAENDRDLPRGLLQREGMLPFAEVVAGSRRLCQAVRRSVTLSLLGSIVGTLLAFYLMFLGSYALLTPMALVAFLLLWTLPVLLMADWTGRY